MVLLKFAMIDQHAVRVAALAIVPTAVEQRHACRDRIVMRSGVIDALSAFGASLHAHLHAGFERRRHRAQPQPVHACRTRGALRKMNELCPSGKVIGVQDRERAVDFGERPCYRAKRMPSSVRDGFDVQRLAVAMSADFDARVLRQCVSDSDRLAAATSDPSASSNST